MVGEGDGELLERSSLTEHNSNVEVAGWVGLNTKVPLVFPEVDHVLFTF